MDDPFASPPVPPSSSSDVSPCPRCQTPMDPARAGYAEDGTLTCATCRAGAEAVKAGQVTRSGAAAASRNAILVPLLVVAFLALLVGGLGVVFMWIRAFN